MRDLFQTLTDGSGSTSTSESNKVKLQRLATRVAADYARAEDWSSQKRILAKQLWRKMYSHCDHLQRDLDRIHPDLVASVMSSVPKAPEVVPRAELPSTLMDVGLGDLEDANDSKSKRKRSLQPVQTNLNGRRSPSFSRPERPSVTSSRQTPLHDVDVTTSKDRANGSLGEHEEERDENLYCFCQRGSFGEMIGCDSDDCKYEWFHIGCVGVSKPLPQTWLCSDCLAKNKRRRRQ